MPIEGMPLGGDRIPERGASGGTPENKSLAQITVNDRQSAQLPPGRNEAGWDEQPVLSRFESRDRPGVKEPPDIRSLIEKLPGGREHLEEAGEVIKNYMRPPGGTE